MHKKTLAIMAAGFGSRFGGLKQLYSFTDEEHSILDFSIYDAIEAGFNTIVFIVRKDILRQFEEKYSNLFPKEISVDFVIQDVANVSTAFKSIHRIKPWGTGHALLMLKGVVKGNFAIINADDFYGKEAFKLMHGNLFDDRKTDSYLMGYKLEKTLSMNGSVSRGECFFNSQNKLTKIIERQQIGYYKDTLGYNEDGILKEIHKDTIVSMNFWGFTPKILDVADKEFNTFLKTYNGDSSEFFITKVVEVAIHKNQKFRVLKTDSMWFGVTYREDALTVSESIEGLIEKGCYPKQLWLV